MEFVTGFIDSPAFKPWDIGDHVSPRLAHSVGNIDNFTLTNELLHQAAFRDGLGNSLHSPDYMVSVLSQLVQKNLQEFEPVSIFLIDPNLRQHVQKKLQKYKPLSNCHNFLGNIWLNY